MIVFTLGIWLHHTSDAQKYFVLRARKGLITDGLFSMCRNPNYFGEMLIYGSYVGKTGSNLMPKISSPISAFSWEHPFWWWPALMQAIVWIFLFYPSWLAKEKSMSRYPEWAEYTSRSGEMQE